MVKNSDMDGRDRRREVLFVGACAAIFLILAACAVYVVVTLAV